MLRVFVSKILVIRFFPLPDYTNSSTENVVLEIYGQIIDENYSKLLIENNDALSLTEVILLDKVQKNQEITEDAVKLLKKKCLIEGRKPNYYISAEIAEITDQKALYTKNKGLNKEFYKELILQHIKNHGSSTREEINELLLDKFPTYMSEVQRKTKIHNLMSEMTDKIQNEGNKAKFVAERSIEHLKKSITDVETKIKTWIERVGFIENIQKSESKFTDKQNGKTK